MKSAHPINLELDAIALQNFCQISKESGKRVYTCRTLTHCQNVYEAIQSRAENDAIVIRLGVGSHYDQFHPNALSKVWVEPNVKKGEADGGTDHDRIA